MKADRKYEICAKLEKEILPKLIVMPTSPDRIPGPLSDVDILYMSEKRKTDLLEVSIDGRKLQGDDLRNALCGCGIHLTLSSTIRILKKSILPGFIDMSDTEINLESQLARLYPEENISTGYVLRPNETILCSSEEKIVIPHDVYAIVSSRFSYTQLGLSIELGTSIIQAGHSGKIHFQIKNNTDNSICIYPHIEVAQLLFFRTVQPSSRKYCETSQSRSYDTDSIPPISRFRKNNESMEHVEKPCGNPIQYFLTSVRGRFTMEIIGLVLMAVFCVFNVARIEYLMNTYLLPFLKRSSVISQCLLIALFGWALTNAFSCVGSIFCFVVKKILFIYRKYVR